MNMKQSVKVCFKKCITFKGRASRSEMWWFFTFYMIVNLIVYSCLPLISNPIIVLILSVGSLVFSLVVLLAWVAVGIRRLHDLDRSGHWYWFYLLPVVGHVLLFVWFCTKGTEGANRFGSLDTE